jgi:hypothetical protein
MGKKGEIKCYLAESNDGLDIVVGQVLGGVALVLAEDVVGHDDRSKNGKALQGKLNYLFGSI